jgi:hypothetical protein
MRPETRILFSLFDRIAVLAARLAIVGTLVAAAFPAGHYAWTMARERAAISRLEAIVGAQQAFRERGGHGGYAASLESLTTPCPGASAVLDARSSDGEIHDGGYRLTMRPARGASAGPADCHGRSTTTDFLAFAMPIRAGIDGTRSMTTGAAGRVFLFHDAVAPAEADMAPGGLAVPLDAPLRIP